MFSSKVFSRKGNFLARDVDPPIGDIQVEMAEQTNPEPVFEAKDTNCYEGGNIRVRVLKPDAAFIRDISKRLARLDEGVDQLNEKNHTES